MDVAERCRVRDLRIGQSAIVTGYEAGAGAYRARLLAMGLTRGTRLTLRKIAPLGDPMELELRGYCLSLRAAEADMLIVERGGGRE